MKKMLLIILGFFFTGGSIASCDFLSPKKKDKKAEKEGPCSQTCKNLPKYPNRCERRW